MKYTNNGDSSLGLGQLERRRLTQLLRAVTVTISAEEAAEVWGMKQNQASKLLSWYQKKGWLRRITQGTYIAVPLDSKASEVVPEEPFVISEKLFSPCYISGANAAHYWELTEQLFQSVTVMAKNKFNNRKQEIAGSVYVIHTIKAEYFFGLKSIWFDNVKVNIADPARTIVDMMIYPQFCGGIRFSEDVLKNYFHSKYKSVELLLNYMEKIDSGAAIKRLGFLVEKNFPEEKKIIEYCYDNLTQGYVKLSSSIDCPRVVTRWRLRVPDSWKNKLND